MKRIAALLLTLLLVVGLLPTVALAASSEEEALGEVQIYHDGTEMSYLSINGRVRTPGVYLLQLHQRQGPVGPCPGLLRESQQPPACPRRCPPGRGSIPGQPACHGPEDHGDRGQRIPQPAAWSVWGWPAEYEAYYATKMALWCYLLPNWDIADLTVNPAADQAAASRVLAAAKLIYTDGMYWDKVLTPRITAVPDQEQAYPVTFEGKEYYQQLFTVTSETWWMAAWSTSPLRTPVLCPRGPGSWD